MECLNCKSKLSCGCQKRTASDGKSVCSSCLTKYEQQIKTIKKDDQVLTPQQQLRLYGKLNS